MYKWHTLKNITRKQLALFWDTKSEDRWLFVFRDMIWDEDKLSASFNVKFKILGSMAI